MDSNHKENQFEQSSDDNRKDWDTDKNTAENPTANAEREDDFLSGDNKSRPYPNEPNPNEGYEKSMSPSRNPNIGGDESEYESSTTDDGHTEEEISSNNDDTSADDGVVNRRDSEEISRHDEETRYSSPNWDKDHDGNINV